MDQQISFCSTSDGATIAYARLGSGPPLVRVIGWFSHLGMEWEHQESRSFWEPIAAHHEVFRYDGRGIGLSEPWRDGVGSETRLRDLEAVIDAAGLEQFALFGASEGAATAVLYAAAHPERVTKLVLYGGLDMFGRPGGVSERARAEQGAMLTLVRNGWGRDSPRFRELFTSAIIPSGTPEQIDRFNERQRRSADPETAANYLGAIYDTDVRAEAARVTAPTLVLHRQGDQAMPFAWGLRLAGKIPGARMVPMEGDLHALGIDPKLDEPVVRALLTFLDPDGVEPPGAEGDRPQANRGDAGVPTSVGDAGLPAGISARELEVLRLVATGQSNREIAEQLVIATATVASHVRSILKKTNTSNRAQAVDFAARHHLLDY